MESKSYDLKKKEKKKKNTRYQVCTSALFEMKWRCADNDGSTPFVANWHGSQIRFALGTSMGIRVQRGGGSWSTLLLPRRADLLSLVAVTRSESTCRPTGLQAAGQTIISRTTEYVARQPNISKQIPGTRYQRLKVVSTRSSSTANRQVYSSSTALITML